jgi:hypothetical protein
MNIEDKALDIILDHTSSSEWEDVCKLTWNTDEVQELLIKALKQGQTLPIDSVIVPKGTLCDVCGSDDIIEAPSMGINCNSCNPL